MTALSARCLKCLPILVLLVSTPPSGQAARDTCLMFTATKLADGENMGALYQAFSRKPLTIKAGDMLEYDIYIARFCPSPQVGLDIVFKGRRYLHETDETGARDQNGVSADCSENLTQAVGKWYQRRIALDRIVGWQTQKWEGGFVGSGRGTYTMFLDNVRVVHADGTSTGLYKNGRPDASETAYRKLYASAVVLRAVPREAVSDDAAVEKLTGATMEREQRVTAVRKLRNDVEQATAMAGREGWTSETVTARLGGLSDAMDRAGNPEKMTHEQVDALASRITTTLNSLRLTRVRQHTGHLVGHAHIDAQWLWEWPETVLECKHTFAQALKFMDEFKGFTFTQSSTMFYQATEYHWPELFEKIRAAVARGSWELAGGTVTETDSNIVSSEAHARQFLYGQRYFRERFDGRQATVAWAPDTFGHNAQGPQITRLGGCKYYYFCRCGNGHPLFLWEGLDGTRVLTFQEITGSWYNSDLTNKQFDEIWDQEKRTGTADMLWVYGVGNHGGGPTREYLKVATDWMKRVYLPTVEFSTAERFFRTIEKTCDPKRLPVVKGELGYIFEGCYTSHGDIKRWNDDAQAATESAETVAALAARYGYPYPGTELRRNWEDICWNQHHDTIDGTAIHPAYEKSREMLTRVVASSRRIEREAIEYLAAQTSAPPNALFVFNPTGAARTATVEVSVPGKVALDGGLVAVTATTTSPVQMLSKETRQAVFTARDLPPFGFRVYRLEKPSTSATAAVSVSVDGTRLENSRLRVTLSPNTGWIDSLYDKEAGRELATSGPLNLQEIHWEHARSAWDVGPVDHIELLSSTVSLKVLEQGPARAAVEFSRKFRDNTITQRLALGEDSGMVECTLVVDWKETARNKPKLLPFLKIATPLGFVQPTATFDIPFGNVTRPCDGHEVPALNWCDVADSGYGFSFISDCKHGYSVTSSTVRLSIVRVPTDPDPTADNYEQSVHYALYPHRGDWRAAGVVHKAAQWRHPVAWTGAIGEGRGVLPGEGSLVSCDEDAIVITAVKRAEDDDDLVVRYFNSTGSRMRTTLRTNWRVQKASGVNFLEDVVEAVRDTGPAGVVRDVSGYEIETLKLRLKPVERVRMTGTRGGGGIRPF